VILSDPFAFLVSTLFLIPGALIAVPVHELAHGFAALRMGDATPRNRGFLSPTEPRKFFSLYGTLALLFWRVGWGQSVPINESRLNSLGQKVIYALAGPIANLALAVVFGLALRTLVASGSQPSPIKLVQPPISLLGVVVWAAFFVNLAMFAFNLLPIPGLDGWRIIDALFRRRSPRFFFEADMNRYRIVQFVIIGFVIISFVPGINLLNVALLPIYAPASYLILGQCVAYPGLSPCPQLGGS